MLVAKRMKLADILVVDPDPDMVDVITAVLEGEGYSCRSAANGQEALEACLRAVPAVVLMDLQLPVMNGWICARWLRARYDNTLAIVIMTTTRYVEEHRAPDDGRRRTHQTVRARSAGPRPRSLRGTGRLAVEPASSVRTYVTLRARTTCVTSPRASRSRRPRRRGRRARRGTAACRRSRSRCRRRP